MKQKVWALAATTLQERDLEPLVDSVVGLDGLDGALARIAQGKTQGRILVNPRI
jgi:NADPH:quinone reductase-like Zn-dependent oxidoreductase